MSFTDQLQPASFRGVPFAVTLGDGRFGRRLAAHEYPFRDKPWAEDLGRRARKIGLQGFLVEDSRIYGGGSVIDQRERLIAAAETEGPGTLVHPSLGRLTVSVAELGIVERWDQGRYFELQFSLIESGDRLFPAIVTATGPAVLGAADAADAACGATFADRIGVDLKLGAATVGQAVSQVAFWTRQATRLADDATNLYNMVGRLKGNFGRYFGGRNYGGFTGVTATIGGVTGTVQSLINQGTVARNNVSVAAAGLTAAAKVLAP